MFFGNVFIECLNKSMIDNFLLDKVKPEPIA
jgi:hypothetical protein